MMKLTQLVQKKNKSINLEKNKVLKNKFEILLQNNDKNYIHKIFSSNQNEIKKTIEHKFIEKKNKEFLKFYLILEIMILKKKFFCKLLI